MKQNRVAGGTYLNYKQHDFWLPLVRDRRTPAATTTKCPSGRKSSGQMSIWLNVFLGSKSSGQMLSGQMSSGQMSIWANVVWANVSGQMS
jgi:hypothetical protein